MTKLSVELLYAVGEVLLLAIGTGVVSTLGIYFELLALGAFSAGDLVLGLWLFAFGCVALYFGIYAIGLTELQPRLKKLLTQRVD